MDGRDVQDMKNAAYIFSQSCCALIQAMGMMSENMQRQACGHSMAYVHDRFAELITEYGIHHNQVISHYNR